MSVTYKTIRKNNGSERIITVPSASMKRKQQMALQSAIPLETSYGTCPSKGIKQFVLAHSNAGYIIKVDIQDFFHSIKYTSFIRHVSLTQFPNGYPFYKCFYRLQDSDVSVLPQGFPTSPYLANLYLYKFDNDMEGAIRNIGGTYTRYFDDIVVSFTSEPDEHTYAFVMSSIRNGLRDLSLNLNETKTRCYVVDNFYSILGVTYSKDTSQCTTKAKHKDFILKHIKWHCHNYTPEDKPKHIDRLVKGKGHLAWIQYIEGNSNAYSKCKKQIEQYEEIINEHMDR